MAETIEISVLTITEDSVPYLDIYSSRISIGRFSGTLSDAIPSLILYKPPSSSPFSLDFTINKTTYSIPSMSSAFLEFNYSSQVQSFELVSSRNKHLSVTLHFTLIQPSSSEKCDHSNNIQSLLETVKSGVDSSPSDSLIISLQDKLDTTQEMIHENTYLRETLNTNSEMYRELQETMKENSKKNALKFNELDEQLKRVSQKLTDSQNELAEETRQREASVADCEQLTRKLTENENLILSLKDRLVRAIESEKNALRDAAPLPPDPAESRDLKKDYQEKLTRSMDSVAALKSENSELSDKIVQLKHQISELDTENEDLKSELAKRTSAHNKLSSDYSALEFKSKHQAKKLQSDLEFANFERDQAMSEKAQLQSQADSVDSLGGALKNRLKEKLTKAENELNKEKRRNEDLRKELELAQSDSKQLKSDLKSKGKTNKEHSDQLKTNFDDYTKRLNEEMKSREQDHETALDDLKQQLSQLHSEYREQIQALGTQTKALTVKDTQISDLTRHLDELKRRLSTLESSPSAEDLNLTILDLNYIQSSQSCEVLALKQELGNLQDLLATERFKSKKSRDKILELKEELKLTQQEIIRLQNSSKAKETYLPVKSDPVDMKLAEFINRRGLQLKVAFIREDTGQYRFGFKRVFVKIENGVLALRVGGGYMLIDEFVELYTPGELDKLSHYSEKMNRIIDQMFTEKKVKKKNLIEDLEAGKFIPLMTPNRTQSPNRGLLRTKTSLMG